MKEINFLVSLWCMFIYVTCGIYDRKNWKEYWYLAFFAFLGALNTVVLFLTAASGSV